MHFHLKQALKGTERIVQPNNLFQKFKRFESAHSSYPYAISILMDNQAEHTMKDLSDPKRS